MRVASIDIGTNTVLLLVAEREETGVLSAITERATITRLGQGVDRTRRLAPEAVARTIACLDDYARTVRDLGASRVGLVGTSAMRDAGGSDELRRHIRAAFGVDVRVIGGDEEGRLTFRGALSGLPLAGESAMTVFDIGGGSSEVVRGRVQRGQPSLSYVKSFDVGSVRLTERHIRHDPPTADEVAQVDQVLRETFAEVPPLDDGGPPIGIAGTMTTLAAVSMGLSVYDGTRVHGHVMRCTELRRVVDYLGGLDLESRRQVRGMEPQRADVIVAGGRIALAVLARWHADAVMVSDRGVRWGLAEELLQD